MSRQYEGKLIDLGKIGYLDPEVTILTLEDTGENPLYGFYNWLGENIGKKLRVTRSGTSFIVEVLEQTK